MSSLWYLCVCLCLLGCVLADSDADFNAILKLYSGTKYKNAFATIKFNYASRCYSLDCDSMDNKVASAQWDKLPTSSSDTLIFYSEADCTGHKGTARLSKASGVTDFKQLRGLVSSFMLKTKNTTTMRSRSGASRISAIGPVWAQTVFSKKTRP